MDPFTIATTVVKLTGTCLSTAKTLHAIRSKYNDSPMTIVTICSETAVIGASLSHLQTIIIRKQDFVRTLDTRPELAYALDAALTGCTVIFSCLDKEISKITAKTTPTGALSWKGKGQVVWNHDKLQDLLGSLRGQQSSINILIQLVQLDSLGEIKQLLVENRPVLAESMRRTESLRHSTPGINVPASIYSENDCQSIYSLDLSIVEDSMQHFDFDHLLINSKVYSKAPAGRHMAHEETREPPREDLDDDSDSHTVRENFYQSPDERSRAPGSPRVPEGWEPIWNAEYGEWHYVNKNTKKSQWDKPTEALRWVPATQSAAVSDERSMSGDGIPTISRSKSRADWLLDENDHNTGRADALDIHTRQKRNMQSRLQDYDKDPRADWPLDENDQDTNGADALEISKRHTWQPRNMQSRPQDYDEESLNDLRKEAIKARQDRDRALFEFEQLSSKNVQLADLNNDLTHQIQERFRSQVDVSARHEPEVSKRPAPKKKPAHIPIHGRSYFRTTVGTKW